MPSPSRGKVQESAAAQIPATSPEASEELSVWDYEDYHAYLRDWIEFRKAHSANMSYQWLANKCEFSSRSFLRRVALGEKNLSLVAAHRLSKAMEHGPAEAEYFSALVALGNARTPKDREHHQDRLRQIPRPRQGRILNAGEFELFREWYIVPLRELVTNFPFAQDWNLLGQQLDPPISGEQAREAVELLLELGLLQKDGELYRQVESNLSTPTRSASRLVRNYQLKTLELAGQSLARHDRDLRHISTLTVGLDAEHFEVVREKVRNFRRELIALASEIPHSDRVYQVNLQLFPLTRTPVGSQSPTNRS
ncbi:MAG: TIGR02147 family protein [Fibrobacteres bacterium]|nr:TIGR02147 family protein [Fibrobacterota bacterium]